MEAPCDFSVDFWVPCKNVNSVHMLPRAPQEGQDKLSDCTKSCELVLFHCPKVYTSIVQADGQHLCWVVSSVRTKGRHWYKARFQATRTLRAILKLGPLSRTSNPLWKKKHGQNLNEEIYLCFGCGHIALVPKPVCTRVPRRPSGHTDCGPVPQSF